MSSSGDQKIAGRSCEGSAGKLQPPAFADPVAKRMAVDAGRGKCDIVPAIRLVAAQPLPGQIGSCQLIDMIVVRGGAPPGCIWSHRSPNPPLNEAELRFRDRRLTGSQRMGNRCCPVGITLSVTRLDPMPLQGRSVIIRPIFEVTLGTYRQHAYGWTYQEQNFFPIDRLDTSDLCRDVSIHSQDCSILASQFLRRHFHDLIRPIYGCVTPDSC